MTEDKRQALLAAANEAAGGDTASWPAVAAWALDEVGQLRALLRELVGHEEVVGKYAGPCYICVFCQWDGKPSTTYDLVEHASDCPMLRARAMLGEA